VKLIAGLGNPGTDYSRTRHNIGFLSVDLIAAQNNLPFDRDRTDIYTAIGTIFDEQLILAKPQTFMNLSGEAVAGLIQSLNMLPEDIIVIHDDMDIEFGKLKIKTGGGSAGHKGVASLIYSLGTDRFIRIRAGIGKPTPGISPVDYVLQNFGDSEYSRLAGFMENICSCVESIVRSGPEKAMHIYHTADNITE